MHSDFFIKNKFSIDLFQKDFSSFSPIEHHFTKFLKKNKDNIRSNWFLKEDQVEKIYRVSNFQQLSKEILQLEGFKKFDSCQILLHKKGNPYFLSFSNSFLSNSGETLFDLKAFNQIFNSVKKSKAKIFNQTSIESKYLNLVGHFLAKEIEFKNFNVLFILSMNSFIPNTKDDIEQFESIVDFLSPYIQILCEEISQKEHSKIINLLYTNFPFGLEITNNERVIFKNNFFEIYNKNECQCFTYSELQSFNVNIFIPSKLANASSMHHFQRISLLGELLNTLQHELSNPLFGIKLAGDLLQLDASDEDTKHLIEELSLSAQRSQEIIKNFSSLYHNNEEIVEISILKLLDEVITLTKSESKQIKKAIINQTLKEEVVILANASYLTQIIFNLIINAAQAIKNDKADYRNDLITIRILQIEIGKIRLEISDSGPGIKKENLEKVFEPFFTTKIQGTGLGLSICQSLADKMGSSLKFKNNYPFPGVTFWIDFNEKT